MSEGEKSGGDSTLSRKRKAEEEEGAVEKYQRFANEAETAADKMLFQLLYCSKSRARPTREELNGMLATFQENNIELSVSGLLAYHEGIFIQILEGQRRRVQELFGRIEQDDRHYDVRLLIQGPIEKRSYSAWSMALKVVNQEDLGPFQSLDDLLVNNEGSNDSTPVQAFLLQVAQSLRSIA